MNDGWIRLHRAININPLWLLESFTKAQAWVDLILNANYTQGVMSVRGNIINIERGQLGWSEVTMAKRWRWSRDKVRRFLSYLEDGQNIRQQKTQITTIITICNYDKYQTDTTTDNTADNTAKKQQKNNRQDTIKEREEKKEIIEEQQQEECFQAEPALKVSIKKSEPKPDFSATSTFTNPGFSRFFCCTIWADWCRTKKAPYRLQSVAEDALKLLHELSGGDETRASEALRIAKVSDWQSFHWHFQHQNTNDHARTKPNGRLAHQQPFSASDAATIANTIANDPRLTA